MAGHVKMQVMEMIIFVTDVSSNYRETKVEQSLQEGLAVLPCTFVLTTLEFVAVTSCKMTIGTAMHDKKYSQLIGPLFFSLVLSCLCRTHREGLNLSHTRLLSLRNAASVLMGCKELSDLLYAMSCL